MTKEKPRILVRGICPAGHVVETYADPGRVRWEGNCPEENCNFKVKAKRIPLEISPIEEIIKINENSSEPYPIARVGSYEQRESKPNREQFRGESGKFESTPIDRISGESEQSANGSTGETKKSLQQGTELPVKEQEPKAGPDFKQSEPKSSEPRKRKPSILSEFIG